MTAISAPFGNPAGAGTQWRQVGWAVGLAWPTRALLAKTRSAQESVGLCIETSQDKVVDCPPRYGYNDRLEKPGLCVVQPRRAALYLDSSPKCAQVGAGDSPRRQIALSSVGIGPTGRGGVGLTGALDLHAPHLSRAEPEGLMRRAHPRCPHRSQATKAPGVLVEP